MPKRTTATKRRKGKKVGETEPIWLQMVKLRYGHYPLTEEDIQRELEALRRFAGAVKTDPEILYTIAMETDPSRLGLTDEEVMEWMKKKRGLHHQDACDRETEVEGEKECQQ